MRAFKAREGFTVVELLIVMALIAILSIGALVAWQSQFAKARDAQRKTDLDKMQIALRLYYEDNGRFPTADLMECRSTLMAPYLDMVPCDPKNLGNNIYNYVSDGPNKYVIYTNLEYTGDRVITDIGCSSGCGPDNANYFVSSDNVDVGSSGGEEGTLPTCPNSQAPEDERYCFANVCSTCCPPGGYRCSRTGTRCIVDVSCIPTPIPTPPPGP